MAVVVRKRDPNATGRKRVVGASASSFCYPPFFSERGGGDEMKMHSAPLKLEERLQLPAHGMKR